MQIMGSERANAHAAPVHRLHVHGPERLHAAIAHVRAHAKAPSSAFPKHFLAFFTAVLSAQFCLIFCELACSFLANKNLQPACKCLLVQTMLKTICRS